MFCIVAFIIFLVFFPVLGFFPGYRQFFKKSWGCVVKKATFKPCDIDLEQEIKGKILAKTVYRFPKFTKFIDKTFSFWALLFVILNIWSLIYTLGAGLNLLVYDTCDPTTGEGCALSGDSCGVSIATLSFDQALESGQLVQWATQPFTQFSDTVSKIPNRLKTWKAEDYLAEKPTYYKFTDSNSTALEIIDPGCPSCKKLWGNIKSAGFTDKYNLSYLVYPIPSAKNNSGYRFNNSKFIAQYLETLKDFPKENEQKVPADWQLLNAIFTGKNGNEDLQYSFSYQWSPKSAEAKNKIESILKEIGYTDNEIATISEKAQSDEITDRLAKQKDIVENKIQTIKIPTIIFGNRRFDRVVETKDLK